MMRLRILLAIGCCALIGIASDAHAQQTAGTAEEIAKQEQEIKELDKKITELKAQRNDVAAEANIIEAQVQRLAGELKKAELELTQTRSRIDQVQDEHAETGERVEELGDEMDVKRASLQVLIRELYEHEQQSFVRLLFSENSLSEALRTRSIYQGLQEQLYTLITELRSEQEELEEKQEDLEQQEQDLSQLADLATQQRGEIASAREERNTFLEAKRSEQLDYEVKIKEARQAREEIENRIFTLQDAGVEVTLDNAFDMARFAQSKTAVRPALLLAVLKVESNVGESIGTGKFPSDMHPGSREAFIRITSKLGLDPNTAPISRRPASGKGWGGAMGPAQIMPATWEGIEGRVASLAEQQPADPYNLTHAFMATAIFLADRGATNAASEREAVGRYIAGPNWSYYSWYIDRVMAVAAEYEKEL